MAEPKQVTTFTIPQTHLSLAGHFPGNPVVPGVVILQKIISIFQQQHPQFSVAGIPNAKFIKPVLPAVEVKVEFSVKNLSTIFLCSAVDGTVLAKGELRLCGAD